MKTFLTSSADSLKKSAGRMLFVVFSCLFLSYSLFAQNVEITNVSAKLIEKSKIRYVQIDYNLNKSSVIEIAKIELRDPENKLIEVKPNPDYLSGDLGWVEVKDESTKTILWEYDKTLVESGLSSKYKCKVSLQYPGTKPVMARMKIKKMELGIFRVPTNSVDLASFDDGTETFIGAGGLAYYGDWHTTVDEGATFFPGKQVVNFPYYNHASSNFSGYPNLASGSSFLALKDVVTGDKYERRIWICWAKGKNQGVGGAVYWDFQIRYFEVAGKKQFCKIGSIGNDGQLTNLDYPDPEVIITYQDVTPVKSNEISLSPPQISISISPVDNYKIKPGNSETVKLTVLDLDKNPLEGATVKAIDELRKPVKEEEIGTTNSSGTISYKIVVASDFEPGDYEIKYVAIKDKSVSDTLLCKVKVSLKPVLEISATPVTIEQDPGTKVTIDIVVKDDEDNLIEGALVRCVDYDSLFFDGVEKDIDSTDKYGRVTFQQTIPDEADPEEYEIGFYAVKEDQYDQSDTSDCAISVSGEKNSWTYYKGGTAYQIYKIEDGGVWEGAGKDQIEYSGKVSVNDFFWFEGDITIDTTSGNVNVRTDGTWYLKNIKLPWNDNPTDLIIWALPFNAKVADKLLQLGALASSAEKAAKMLQFSGFGVLIEDIELVGGLKSTGIKVSGSLLIGGIGGKCNLDDDDKEKDPTWDADGLGRIAVKDLEITTGGIHWAGFSIKNIGVGPSFCLKQLSVTYDKEKDFILGTLGADTPIGEFEGSLGWLKGKWDYFKLVYNLPDPLNIPMPPPYPSIFAWKGFAGEANGISQQNENNWVAATGLFCNAKINELATISGFPAFKDIQDLFEIDLTLRYYPYIWQIEGEGAMRMIKLPGTDSWSVDGKQTIFLRMWQSLGQSGEMNIGRFGGDKAVYMLNGKSSFSWYPELIISGEGSGECWIPNIYPDNVFFQLVNAALGLPFKIGSVKVMWKNLQFGASIYHWAIGPWYVTLDLSRNSDDPKYFIAAQGSLEALPGLNVRINNTPAEIIFGEVKNDMSFPAKYDKYKSNNLIQSPDTTYWDVTLTDKTSRLFFKVYGKDTPPNSFLVNPNNEIIYDNLPDSSVMYYPGKDPNKNMAFWMIVNKTPGKWRLGIPDPQPGDSVVIFATRKFAQDFSIISSQKNRDITVTWDNSASSDSSVVDVFLDDDNQGFDGQFIGRAREKDGVFHYAMNDSLKLCSYYLYAYRWDQGIGSNVYSGTLHTNNKAKYAPPQNITAVSNLSGQTIIKWDIPPDTTIRGYLIRITDPAGKDSTIYRFAYYLQNQMNITISNHANKKIAIQTQGSGNLTGCWSSDFDITTGLEYDETAGLDASSTVISIIPNPASAEAMIRINLPRASNIEMALYDLLGNKLGRLAGGRYDAGLLKTTINTDEFTNGTYFIRLQTDSEVITAKLIIIK